mgnify:CR=1 FL=1
MALEECTNNIMLSRARVNMRVRFLCNNYCYNSVTFAPLT